MASLDSSERKLLLNSDSSNVLYSQGHLLFLRETTLMAQPFDPQRLALTGEAFPVAEQIQTQGNPPAGVFSASENGVLAYQTGSAMDGFKLTWFDRGGNRSAFLENQPFMVTWSFLQMENGLRSHCRGGKGAEYLDLRCSAQPQDTVYVRLGDRWTSIWSPDGAGWYSVQTARGISTSIRTLSDGSGTEAPLLEDNVDKFPESWSPMAGLSSIRSPVLRQAPTCLFCLLPEIASRFRF